MKRHSLVIILGLFLFFIFCDVFGGALLNVVNVRLDQRMSVSGNNLQLTPGNAPKKLWGYTGTWFPYAVVYSFPVNRGNRYTLYFYYPADKFERKIVILGENPIEDAKVEYPTNLTNYLSFYADQLTTHSNISPCRETRRFNFTVHPQSRSNRLYLICMFHEPLVPLDFMLKSSADPDSDVKPPSLMPGCESLGKIYWGKILDAPLFLIAAEEEEDRPEVGSANMHFEDKGWGPIPAGDREFVVPPGKVAKNFRASVHLTSEQKAWKIERIKPEPSIDVYRYIYGLSLKEQRYVESEPLGKLKNLVLPPGTYLLSMSGDTGSYMHLYFDII